MDIVMPQLGETVSEGTVGQWHKSPGDSVAAGELLVEIESDKAAMEITAPAAGILREVRVARGATVPVGTALAVLDTADERTAAAGTRPAAGAVGSPAPPAAPAAAPASALPGTGSARRARGQRRGDLSPVVRRLAAESGVDPALVSGSGRDGRVTRRDMLAVIAARTSIAAAGGNRRVPFSRVRRITAEHMVRSKATSAHVLQAVEVDFSAVERVRAREGDAFRAQHGHSLTYLPFVAHAVCAALREYPHLNARVDGDALDLYDAVQLAIAVDLGPGGLVAPVLRDAQRLSVRELALGIGELARRARAQQLRPEEYVGGTYTLSNSGSFGTLLTAPIINQPQVAILSTDGVRKRPVVVESESGDTIAIRPIGILAQSFDHRAVDGAYSAGFLARVRARLEHGTFAPWAD